VTTIHRQFWSLLAVGAAWQLKAFEDHTAFDGRFRSSLRAYRPGRRQQFID